MSSKTAIVGLSVLLVAAIGTIIWLYPLATRPLFNSYDQPLIDRTKALRTKQLKGETISAFPVVTRSGPKTCVELRTWERDGIGSFTACYVGEKLVETSMTAS